MLILSVMQVALRTFPCMIRVFTDDYAERKLFEV